MRRTDETVRATTARYRQRPLHAPRRSGSSRNGGLQPLQRGHAERQEQNEGQHFLYISSHGEGMIPVWILFSTQPRRRQDARERVTSGPLRQTRDSAPGRESRISGLNPKGSAAENSPPRTAVVAPDPVPRASRAAATGTRCLPGNRWTSSRRSRYATGKGTLRPVQTTVLRRRIMTPTRTDSRQPSEFAYNRPSTPPNSG